MTRSSTPVELDRTLVTDLRLHTQLLCGILQLPVLVLVQLDLEAERLQPALP